MSLGGYENQGAVVFDGTPLSVPVVCRGSWLGAIMTH